MKVVNKEKKESVGYGKRTIALFMTIIYFGTMSPAFIFAENNNIQHSTYVSVKATDTKKVETSKKENSKKLTDNQVNISEKLIQTNENKEKTLVEILPVESKDFITREKGGIVKLGKVQIEIPAGAVKEDTEISITRLSTVNETGELIKNVTELSGGYRFLPAGTKFEKPVVVSIPYAKELNMTEAELNDMCTYFYDTEKLTWVKLERKELDKENGILKSYTTHFTDMINATLTVPETAGPVDFNINSLKNLEAAKPDSHLIKFNPPKVSNTGDASFSFELQIPQGRNGLQPSVGISYSSGAGNGIMGRGFDVNYGSVITVDTRHHLPEFNSEDTYIKDGVKLAAIGTDNREYEALRKTTKERIVRYNAFDVNDYWEVTDTKGTIYRYGFYKTYNVKNYAYIGKKDNTKDQIYSWYLTEIEDVDGNTVLFEYTKDEEYVYPSIITYTGNKNAILNKKGKYFVKFNYIDDTDENHREDVRIDARSRLITKCRWLLKNIECGYDKKVNRTYEFIYKTRESEEKYITELCVWNTGKSEKYSYNFDYNEINKDIKDGKIIYDIFDSPNPWITSNHPINSSENNNTNKHNISMSSSSSSGYSVNASFGAGVGTESIDARITGGGGGSSNTGSGYTNTTLMDINGDGISDIVKQRGNYLYVYVCQYDEAENFTYNTDPCKIEIGTQINLEKTNGTSSSGNVYGGAGDAEGQVSAGYSYVHSTSQGSTQTVTGFVDIDGDGLIDIVTGSNKYLKNESKGNNIVFSPENIKNFSSGIKFELNQVTKDLYSKKYTVQRPFRAWKADKDGMINVTQTINQESKLKGNVYINDSKIPASSDQLKHLSIKSGQYLYFVPDIKNNEDNWNIDVDWNINIKYEKIKPFLIRDNYIILLPPNKITLKNQNTKDLEFNDEKLQAISNLYEIEKEEHESGITYSAKLKNDYRNIPLSEEGQKCIFENNLYIPGKIFNHRKNGNNSFIEILRKKINDNNGPYIKVIFDSYIFDSESDCFRLKESIAKNNADDNLNKIYNALKNINFDYSQFYKDILLPYVKVGLQNKNSLQIISYYNFSDKINNKTERNVNFTGCLSDYSVSVIDDIAGDEINTINIQNKLLTGKTDAIVENIDNRDDTCIITLKSTDGKYNFIYYFTDLTYLVSQFSELELMDICKKQYNSKNILSGIYNLFKDKEKEITEKLKKEAEEKGLAFNNEQPIYIGEDFIKSIFFEKITPSVTMKILTAEESSEILNFIFIKNDSGYILNKNFGSENKEKIEDFEQKLELYEFLSNDFNYYHKDTNGNWILNSNVTDEDKEIIKNVCKQCGYGLYKTTYKKIEYNSDFDYELNDSKYELICLNNNVWEKNIVDYNNYLSDASKQFSTEDLVIRNSIGNYKYYVIDINSNSEINIQKEDTLIINHENTLYGGKNFWSYGIWQGTEKENPFSQDSLNNRTTNNEVNDNEDYDYKSQASNNEEELRNKCKDELPIDTDDYKLSYYLPFKTSAFAEIWTDDVNINLNSLIGNLDITEKQEMVDSDGEMDITRIKNYSAPYIYKDKIVCNRAGGETFYNIEGINGNSPNGEFCINKSRNTSKEDSHGPQLQISVVSAECSFSNGKGSSYQEQGFFDITGDKIPDIVYSDGNSIKVKSGIYNKDTKELRFKEYNISGVSGYISESTNDNNTRQGGIGASVPAVQANISAKGNVRSLSMSYGAGGSTGSGNNEQIKGFLDLNGDGISDYIDNKSYQICNGRVFKQDPSFEGLISLQKSSFDLKSLSLNTGLGGGSTTYYDNAGSLIKDQEKLSKIVKQQDNSQYAQKLSCSGNIGAGIGSTESTSSVNSMYLDINGDGLVDIVEQKDNKTYTRFNTGSSFTEAKEISLPGWGSAKSENPLSSNISNTVSTNGSVGVSVNISVRLLYVVLNFTTSVGGGLSNSSTVNLADISMMDIDGDGKVDQVLQYADGSVYWKRNKTGKAGLLKSIILPQGGQYDIEYKGKYGTTFSPGFKYVMSEVMVSDGINTNLPNVSVTDSEEQTVHTISTKYIYNDAYFDRIEKDSYGYKNVNTILPDGTYNESVYNTEGIDYKYNLMGALINSKSKSGLDYNGIDKILEQSFVEYINSEDWMLVKKEINRSYEKDDNYIENINEYDYDDNGNVIFIKQYSNDEKSKPIYAYIKYNEPADANSNIVSNPSKIKVFDHEADIYAGDYLRFRSGEYDKLGHLISLTQYSELNDNNKNSLTTYIDYDPTFGTITNVTDPSGISLTYEYDSENNQFIEKVSQVGIDKKTYESELKYDFDTQTKSYETDPNGNRLEYEYDNWQRISSIKTPKDKGNSKSITYSYSTPETVKTDVEEYEKHNFWYAKTQNKFNFDDDRVIETIVQIDGLGQILRTAKTGLKWNPEYKITEQGWNVSGAQVKDLKGRIVTAGQAYFENTLNPDMCDDISLKMLYPTQTIYDEKDRDILIKAPFRESKTSETEYIETKKVFDITSDNQLKTVLTDPKGINTIQIVDAKGNIIYVEKYGKKFEDSSTEEILTAASYEYNAMGEMLKAWDIEKKYPIEVVYDLLGRKIQLSSKDGGTYWYEYDEKGNLCNEVNSKLLESGQAIKYFYDNFNRLEKILYSDTDFTQYQYADSSVKGNGLNQVGRLVKVRDASGTIEYEYGELGEVTKESRTLTQRNNHNALPITAVMTYKSNYLGQMESISYPDGDVIEYTYDDAGQIIGVHGKFDTFVENIGYDEFGQRIYIKYGNGIETNYEYIPETRLLAEINTVNKRGDSYQNIIYAFDKVGNINGYTNDCMKNGNYKTAQTYWYDGLNQLIKVEGNTELNKYHIEGSSTYKSNYVQTFNFDILGNMQNKKSSEVLMAGSKTGDDLNYDLSYIRDEAYSHRFTNIGNRYFKYDQVGNIIAEKEGDFNEDSETYYVIDKIEDGVYGVEGSWGYQEFNNGGSQHNKKSEYLREYTWNEKNQLIKSSDNTITVNFVYGQDGKRSNKYTDKTETMYYNNFWTYYIDGSTSKAGGSVSKHIFLGETRLATVINDYQNILDNVHGYENDHVYYYHSDHLGSAQLVTDGNGDEYQRIEYTPYGESWLDIKINRGRELTPLSYKFSAKERDEETGLYYYGARYLDPKYSLWISADPAMNSGEYFPVAPTNDEAKRHNSNLPGMGGVYNTINFHLYHYAGNNPIKYSDPTGRETDDTNESNVTNNVNNFLSRSDDITALFFSILKAIDSKKIGVKEVLSEKYNSLGIPEGTIIAFTRCEGNPEVQETIDSFSGKFSKFFLAATILIQFIDVCLVAANTNGNSEAISKRLVRNTITTAATYSAAKFGTFAGGKIGTCIHPGIGTIIGGAVGGIGLGVFVDIKLNDYFDDLGW